MFGLKQSFPLACAALVGCSTPAADGTPRPGGGAPHGGSGAVTATGGAGQGGSGAAGASAGTATHAGTAGSGGTSGTGVAAGTGAGPGTGGSAPQAGATGGGGTPAGGSGTGGAAGTSAGGRTDAGSGGRGESGGASAGGSGNGGRASAGGAPGGSGASAGGSGNGTPTFHVFLLLGQSNMAGYPKAEAADKTEDPRVRVLGFDDCAETGRKTDQWDTAAPPLHECWNSALGPGDYFAKTLVSKLPSGDSIGLVPCAISGEKIETFLKSGGSKYTYIVDRAKLAQQAGGVVEGMLFHQGESNCGDSAWPGKVSTLVSDLRKDLKLGDVPFLAGELVYSGNCSQHNQQVAKLPGLINNAFVVSAEGLALDPADTQWHLHFGHDAQVEFGKRYAAKMSEALGL